MPLSDDHNKQQAAHAWHTYTIGARVFDPDTAQDGTVVASMVSHAVINQAQPAAAAGAPSLFTLPKTEVHETVVVQLDDGNKVTRDAADILPLPKGLHTVPADLAPPSRSGGAL